MKRNNLFFSLSMALVFSMVMQTPIQAAKTPKLSKKSVSLCIGDSAKLQMKNTKKSVTWKSKNEKIVSVNKKGKIKAKKSGSTKVIAKLGKKNYKCKVIVKKQKLNKTSINLFVGENKKLKASGISKKADINWVSTDNEVATVYNGEVVAVGEGKATIKAVIPEVFGKTLKCKVTVKEDESDASDTNDVENITPDNNTKKPIDNTNSGNQPEQNEENKNNSSSTVPPYISISGGNGNSGSNSSGNGSGGTTVVTNTNAISIVEKEKISYGSKKTYSISISGSEDIGTVTWSSSNDKVLRVEQNGDVYGICPGTAKLRANTSKGLAASIDVEVVKIESYLPLILNGNNNKYDIKERFKNIDIKSVQLKSEDETIASVDENGIITGLKKGETKVIVSLNGTICVEFEVNVSEIGSVNPSEPSEIYLNYPKTLVVGSKANSGQISVPSGTKVTWESSNPEVLSVDDYGEITALSAGEATITVYLNGKACGTAAIEVQSDEAELIYNNQKTVVIGCSNKEEATKMTIPDGVKMIGVNAFDGMRNLKSVTMADSVTEIDNNAFRYCSSLNNIKFSNNIKRLGEYTFGGCSEIESIELPETLEEMGGSCFGNCDKLTSIKIPDKVKIISENCFYGCDGLESVTLSVNVERIESWAFNSCYKLKNINIDNIKYIGDSAFLDCASLEKVVIPDTITSKYVDYGSGYFESNIGYGAFAGCSNLKEITLSKNMQYIPENIFKDCSLIKEVVLPENTIAVGRSAFQSCSSLEKVTIPETVIKIDDTAFQYCYSMSTVCGKKGSYAETWANEKGYTFEEIAD